MNPDKAREAVLAWRDTGYSDDEIANLVSQESPELKKLLDAKMPATEALNNVLGLGPVEGPTEEQIAEKAVEEAGYDTEGTTVPKILAGIGADLAISEGGKAAGTAIGAKTAIALGQAGPQAATPEEIVTVPTATAIGYLGGAISGGIAGDIAAQKIENPNKPISWARAGTAAMLNTLPGTELKRGPKLLRNLSKQLSERPVRSQMLLGAAVGPAAMATEQFAETGELPSGTQLALASGMSGVLGGGLGYTSKKANQLLKRVFRKSPVELDRAIYRGDKDAVDYIDGITRMMTPEERANLATPTEILGYISNSAKASLKPSSIVGEKSTKYMRDASNAVLAGEDTGGLIGKRIQEMIKSSDNPEVASDFATKYLAGEIKDIPKEFSGLGSMLSEARGQIREYQQKLVYNHEMGQRALPEPLVTKIEDSLNKGDYLHRAFRWFDDPHYTPTNKQRAAALKSLVDGGMTKGEATEYLAELNAKKADADSSLEFLRSSNTGPLKKRNDDLSPEILDYLGEYRQPGEKVAKTLSVLSRLEAYDSADRKIATDLKEMGLAASGEGIGEDWVPLQLRRGQAHIGEEKLFAPPHVQEAVNSLYAAKTDDKVMGGIAGALNDMWDTGISMSKAAKVVGNPPSYAVQMYGNVANLAGMGINPFKNWGKGGQAALSQFGGWTANKPDQIKRLKVYKERGIMPPGVTYADIQNGLQKGIGAKAQKFIDPLGKAYSVPDIAMRVIAFEHHADMVRKFTNGAVPEDKILDVAQELTNNTYQNYDYLNHTVRQLSRKGIMPQFASFTMELMRNQYHQGRYIKQMLSGEFADRLEREMGVEVNRKAIQIEGAKRLAALTAVYGTTAVGVEAVTNAYMTPEEAQARRETVLPEWDKHQANAMRINEDGEVQWMNSSYIVPHMTMYGMVRAGMRGDSFSEAASNAAGALQEQFVGEGAFLFRSVAKALGDYDPETGDVISTSPDTWGRFVDKLGVGLTDAFEPGIAREIRKSKDQSARVTAARQAGLRVNSTTDENGFSFRTRAYRDTRQQITKQLASARYRDYDRLGRRATKEELGMEYEAINSNYRGNQEKLIKHVNNMRVLGYDDGKIIKMMRDQFVRSEDVLNALDGVVTDLPVVDKMSARQIYEQILEEKGGDPREYIREIADKDRELGRALIEYDKEYRIKKLRDVTSRDEVLSNLDSDTKTDFLVRYMMESNDPEMVLGKYMQKRVINAEERRAALLKYQAKQEK